MATSFYGGLAGTSFVLKARFSTYTDMVNAFKQGDGYTDVWYGEYCIIDTINKNHRENGKIYRRGLNYGATNGGAEYVGHIVGTSSGMPYVSMGNPSDVFAQAHKNISAADHRKYINAAGQMVSEPAATINDVKEFEYTETGDTRPALVPGYDGENFVDGIRYSWCNIRIDNKPIVAYDPTVDGSLDTIYYDDDNDIYYVWTGSAYVQVSRDDPRITEGDSWFYVGFTFPYKVDYWYARSSSPYDQYGHIYDDTHYWTVDETHIIQDEDEEHPFFKELMLNVPKGIKGDTIDNLRIIVPELTDKIYDVSTLNKDEHGHIIIPGDDEDLPRPAQIYAGLPTDVAQGNKIYVYDFYVYDTYEDPTVITVYVGDYRQIEAVNLSEHGILSFTYTHDDIYEDRTEDMENKIRWITDIQVSTADDATSGTLTVFYNTLDEHDEQEIEVFENIFTWITSVTLDTDTGIFEVKFNNNTHISDYTAYLDWVKSISIVSNDPTSPSYSSNLLDLGKIRVDHARNTTVKYDLLPDKISEIVKGVTGRDGSVTFTYNTYVDDGSGNAVPKQIFLMDSENSGSYYYMNLIRDMKIDDNWHLLILFTSPLHRSPVGAPASAIDYTDAQGVHWVRNVVGPNVGNSTPYYNWWWKDFGAIKDQRGLLVGLNVTPEQVGSTEIAQVIAYLNENYPNGLTPSNSNLKDKIVTFGEVSDSKKFFAYDYSTFVWYYLGDISDAGLRDVKRYIRENDGVITDPDPALYLSDYGYAMIENTDTTVSNDGLSGFWQRTYNNWTD